MKCFALTTALIAVSLHAPTALAQIACESGSIEDNGACVPSFDEDLCSLDPISALETINAPSLLDGQVGGAGELQVQVRHALTEDRVVDEIVLNEAVAACNYPGPHWTKLVGAADDDCLDAYNSTVPWATAATDCALERSEDDTYVYFTGIAEVRMTETLEALRGEPIERSIVSALEFRIGFVKEASIETTDVVYADPRLLSAVTAQDWDEEEQLADFEMTVSLQAPFKVIDFIPDSSPSGIAVRTADGDSFYQPSLDCDSEDGTEDCLQRWPAELVPGGQTCFLSGSYEYTVRLGCQEDVPDDECAFFGVPLDDPSRLVTISVQLESEDLCATVEELLGVDLSLVSHESFDAASFAFGAEKNAFFQDQPMYYDLRIAAQQGFTLGVTELLECQVSDALGAARTVYTQGAGATSGWSWANAFNAATTDTTEHQHQFEFVPAVPVFGVVPEDSNVETTVRVTVSIVFSNTGRRKRFVLQADTPAPVDANVETQVGLLAAAPEDPPQAEVESDTEGVAPSDDDEPTGEQYPEWLPPVLIGSLVLSCCFFLLFAVVLGRRRNYSEHDIRAIATQVYEKKQNNNI